MATARSPGSSMHVEWSRAVRLSPPSDDAGEPDRSTRLRAEIATSGPDYVRALHGACAVRARTGLLRVDTERPTRAGDFLTAPELHPIFGQTWRASSTSCGDVSTEPNPFTVREYGAGQGHALRPRRRAAARRISTCVRRAIPADRSAGAGGHRPPRRPVGSRSSIVEPSLAAADHRMPLANEFVDALPVRPSCVVDGDSGELYVDWRDGQFVEHSANRPTSGWRTGSRRGIDLVEGQRDRGQSGPARVGRPRSAVDLERGCVLIIDYGARAAELYGRRPAGRQPARLSRPARVERRPVGRGTPGHHRPRRFRRARERGAQRGHGCPGSRARGGVLAWLWPRSALRGGASRSGF